MELTLQQLTELYIGSKTLALDTEKTYRQASRNFCQTLGVEDIHLQALNVLTMTEHRTQALKSVRGATYNKTRRHVSAVLQYGVEEGHLALNAFTKVKAVKAPASLPKLTPRNFLEQVDALLHEPYTPGERFNSTINTFQPHWLWRTLIYMFAYTLIRRKQLAYLKWQDIRWGSPSATPPRMGSVYLASEGNKTSDSAWLPLHPVLEGMLRGLWTAYFREGFQPLNEDPVFRPELFYKPYSKRVPEREGVTVDAVSSGFNAIQKKLGIKLSPHRIRHTGATTLLEKGVPLKQVSDLLTHRSIITTSKSYNHVTAHGLREAVEMFPWEERGKSSGPEGF